MEAEANASRELASWCWMVAMHLGILFVVDFADLTFGMLMIHLFTFDPDWLKIGRRRSTPPEFARASASPT